MKRGRPSAAAGPARSLSSAGRASARQAEGRWLETISDHDAPMAQRIAHLVTNKATAGSSPARGARARLAQRESSGSTRRGSGVRIPDCALRTNRLARRPVVSQPAAGSIPVVLPGGSERRTAQLSVKQSPRHPWFNPRFRHARPRSAVENAPPSEGGDRWFESSRGHPRSRDRAARYQPAKLRHASSNLAGASRWLVAQRIRATAS